MVYHYSTKTALTLDYVRRQDLSIYYGQQSYVSDVASLQISQTLASKGKWRATLGGYYGLYDYSQTAGLVKVHYDIYSMYFALAYQIQLWLTASLGYDRTSVTGSAGVTTYDVNKVTLRVAVGY